MCGGKRPVGPFGIMPTVTATAGARRSWRCVPGGLNGHPARVFLSIEWPVELMCADVEFVFLVFLHC